MRFFLAVALLSVVSASALAAPPVEPNRMFQGRDLFALQLATDPQIRPDGREIAYVRVSFDVMTDRGRQSIWLIDAESGEQRPLVTAAGSHSQPRWSPSGDRIAYVSTAEGGRPQLFVRWLGTGQTAKLADLTEGPGNLRWSPDGKWIAFTMLALDEKAKLGEAPPKPEGADWAPPLELITKMVYRSDNAGYLKPGYTHIYVVSADGGAPRQLTFGAFDEDGPVAWTPDGKYVVITGNRHENSEREPVNSEVYRVALADGAIEELTKRNGPDRAADVSPDGKSIAYLGYDDKYLGYQNVELSVMGLDGSNSRSLTASLDRTIDDATWSHDGRSLYVQYDDKANVKVARVSLNGKMETVAEGLGGGSLDRPYTGGQFSVANNGAVAFTKGSPGQPADIAIARGGKVRQLTHLNDGFLSGKTLGDVKPLKVTSSFDQRDIAAWIVTPPNFDASKKYPLILEIHGGPFSAYGPQFATDYQLYAAAGYAVLSRGFRTPKTFVAAYRRPEVPYAAGLEAARLGATSMIDVSDGLVQDLGHVATASVVGIDVRRDAFEVPEQMRDAANALGVDPYVWILAGGDDHALAATFPPGVTLSGAWRVIGSVHEGTGVTVDRKPWTATAGWNHFR